jgi:hypothetical protein
MKPKGMNNPIMIGKAVSKTVKPALYVAGGIAAIIASYKLYNFLFPGGLSTDPFKEPTDLTNSQAETIAERCYQAMYAAGTDTEALFQALAGLNHNDYVAVSKAFGTRSYFYPTGEAPVFDWMGANLTLEEWLIQELDLSEIKELKKLIPEIF